LELGRATGIVVVTLFRFGMSLEAAHAADRLRVFKSAAWYAMSDGEPGEVEEIMEHSEDQVDEYLFES
jgi:hypothetical protein